MDIEWKVKDVGWKVHNERFWMKGFGLRTLEKDLRGWVLDEGFNIKNIGWKV